MIAGAATMSPLHRTRTQNNAILANAVVDSDSNA